MKKLLLALCLFASRDALAVSGNFLMEGLKKDQIYENQRALPTKPDALDIGFANGFVAGVMFSLQHNDPEVCLPSGHNLRQLMAVALSYFENNPAKLHRPAAILVREAAIQAFPCKR